MRHVVISALFLVLLVSCFGAKAVAQTPDCDARSVWRGEQIQHYVPKAMACVERPNDGFWYDEAIERDVFDRINQVRSAFGLPQLSLRVELRAPARVHSFDMAQEGFFAHVGADGRTPFERISALDRTLVQSETRENLASVTGDLDYTQVGSLLHNILMDSPGHKENILAPNLTHMAIGLVRTEKGAWITQLFVKQDGMLTEPLKTSHNIGDALALNADLPGRDLAGAVFLGANGREYTSFAGDDVPTGDLQLLMIGEHWLDERTRRIIKLNGPSLTLIR